MINSVPYLGSLWLILFCSVVGGLVGAFSVPVTARLLMLLKVAPTSLDDYSIERLNSSWLTVRSQKMLRFSTALSCGVAYAVLAFKLHSGWSLLLAMLVTALLFCLALIDWRHRLVPDVIVLPFLILGLVANTQHLFVPLYDAIIGAVLAYLGLWILSHEYQRIFRKPGIGGGDLKLLAALGAWLGWYTLIWVALFASLIALFSCVLIILRHRNLTTSIWLPYGSYLSLVGWCFFVWKLGQ